jgi:DNA-binding beta-propeller fold protein YncE
MINESHSRGIGPRAIWLIAVLIIACCDAYTLSAKEVAEQVADLRTQDGDAVVRGLDFSPDGNRLAEDSDGKFINIWDWRNKHIEKSVDTPRGLNPVGTPNGLLYSPDGRLLAACASRDGDILVHLWNTGDWSVANGVMDHGAGACDGISFSPNGQFLAQIVYRVGNPGNSIIIHALDTGNIIFGLQIAQHFSPTSVAVSPDGESIAVAGVNSVLLDGKITREPSLYIISILQQKLARTIPTDAMGPLAWSPDGKRIAIAGELVVQILDAQTGQVLTREKLEESAHMNVRFTSDGRYLIESDMNGQGNGLGVTIWDAQHKSLLQKIPGNIGAIAVSHDSKFLAVGVTGHTTIWQFK